VELYQTPQCIGTSITLKLKVLESQLQYANAATSIERLRTPAASVSTYSKNVLDIIKLSNQELRSKQHSLSSHEWTKLERLESIKS